MSSFVNGEITPVVVSVEDAMDKEMLPKIVALFPSGPKGRFFRGTHGVTHYVVEGAAGDPSPSQPKYVVLIHGLGTSLEVYDDLSLSLVADGFTVIRYDFLNHGFSVGSGGKCMDLGADVMVTQVKELLDVVCEKDEKVHAFVGHSTGGIVSILAAHNEELDGREINQLGLVSPALWADKPLVAQLADKVPGAVSYLLQKGVPGLSFAIADAYLKNCDEAFGKNEEGQYIYQEAYEKAKSFNEKLLKDHPNSVGGIGGANLNMLTGTACTEWRAILTEVATNGVRGRTVNTRLIFGDRDVVVPFKSPHLDRLKELSNITLVELPGQGHESLYENSSPIAATLKKQFERCYD
ncbi:hypothetical protein TrST_g6387 [Triparma strigata]|uniref:Serine aminopeptidase S33 domain-containing protein n=1 Tax=Triparma strigata TaxID=1606541 RepID=A0A9W7AYI1_9STRA|nr:hypothetical protein TrST_g6387 [Triparma strigata]